MRTLLFFALVIGFATRCSSTKQSTEIATPADKQQAANTDSQQNEPTPSTANESTSKTQIRYQR
jgi:hypothetical protein